MERVTFLKSFGGAADALNFILFSSYRHRRRRTLTPRPGHPRRSKYGAPMAPQFFFFIFSFTTAEGATPPEGEGNPAEGRSSRVLL